MGRRLRQERRRVCDEGTYPFAGYKAILNEIYNRVLSGSAKTVLDIGFGTGTLTTRLYDMNRVWRYTVRILLKE